MIKIGNKITFHGDFEIKISAADLERFKKVVEFQTLYGADVVVVTADNCHLFADIPLLSARVIAAESLGKHIAVNALDGLIVLDHLPEPQKSPHVGCLSIGFKSTAAAVYAEAASLEPDEAPRNRAERRHGRRADKPVWQKDRRMKCREKQKH